MKILHISMNANYTEGYGYQDNLLPKYQVKLGHDVHLITSVLRHGKDGIETVEECEYVNDYGVHIYRLKNKGYTAKLKNILGVYNLKKYINNIQPDVIMIHGLCNMLLGQAVKYKKKRGCHIIMDNHQDGNTTKINNIVLKTARRIHRAYLKKYISEVDRVYGVTSWRVDYAVKEYGIPKEKMDMLLMGYDTDKIDFDASEAIRTEIRERHGIREDNFVLIIGGKLAKNKNIIETLRAFSRIEDKNMRLVVFGPVYEDVKEDFFKLTEADKRIVYIGELQASEINNYFIASDLGVFPGRHSVVWEQAVGMGLPCIFRDYGEDSHLNIGGNCFALKNCDEDGIYEAITNCISNSDVYETMRKCAVEKGRKQFSYFEIAKKSLECTETKES
ncbi:MAG: glycosyltransferase family 4 protein [Lachnospiraceae bacterium]|nr:glycosyltransferase family 4 protein [Lachnospiraceae bacterium]